MNCLELALKTKAIALVKVEWQHQLKQETTCPREDEMRKNHPYLFGPLAMLYRLKDKDKDKDKHKV